MPKIVSFRIKLYCQKLISLSPKSWKNQDSSQMTQNLLLHGRFLSFIHLGSTLLTERVFSAFRKPVPLEAAQAIIDNDTVVPEAQGESAHGTLLAQHLVQASGGGRYQLHVIVAGYAQAHIVQDNEQKNRLIPGHPRLNRKHIKS